MLKTGSAVTHPNFFHFLHIIEKVIFQRENFIHKPGIDFLILDRWKTSGLIYAKCGKVHPFILKLADMLIQPGDIEIILHSEKSLRDESRDFFEKEEFQNKIRKEYVSLKHKDDISFIDVTNKTREEVLVLIVNEIFLLSEEKELILY